MIKYFQPIGIVLFFIVLFNTSCKKSAYLTDEGIHEARTSLSTYDYLKQHKYHIFDTLILMVDHYNLKDEMNNAGTVFASTNYSIGKYVANRGGWSYFTLDSVYKYLKADTIRQYFMTDKVRVTDLANESPVIYANKGKTVSAIRKIQSQDAVLQQWSGAPVFFLYYIKVLDGLDGSTPAGRADRSVRCQTTNIETSSGGILHVLDNTHSFATF